MKELYTSVVGSHAWEMQRPDSDWDFWMIYQVPSKEFLLGRRHEGGHESSGTIYGKGEPWDLSKFEIGHHVNQLMKGNINHMISVFAPSVQTMGGKSPAPCWKCMFKEPGNQSWVKRELMRIISENPAKNIFHSINGMTTANLKKFFKKGAQLEWELRPMFGDGTESTVTRWSGLGFMSNARKWTLDEWMAARAKKLGQIRRVVRFAFHVLTTGEYKLDGVPLGNGDYEDEQNVRQWQADLEKAYHASDLPDRPDPEPFEGFLLELRMGYLEHEE